jgi:hypothetical protein
MRSAIHSIADQSREDDRVFHASVAAARQIRARHVKVRPHRAITPLKVTPYLLAQTVLLPLVMCGLLVWGEPLLLNFWRACIVFWSGGLDLPFSISSRLDSAGQHFLLTGGLDNTPLPSRTTLLVTAAATVALFMLSLRMKNAKLPLKYPLWIICFVQGFALLYFWLSPSTLPYSIAQQCEELMTIGYVVMLATPVMLAMGYYILNQHVAIKVFHTVLILLFLALLVPHQVLAQALIMQQFSVLFMPVLYICFGAVFDALVFVALYSWAVSDVPANATV